MIQNYVLPKNWQFKTLGDIAEITSSKRVFESQWETSGVPFYRAREIVKLAKQGLVNNEIFISEKMFDEYSIKYGRPYENDIMITGVGTLGACYLVKKNDKFYFKDGNIIWVKNIDKSVSPHYLYHVITSKLIQNQIKRFSAGNTVGTFTIENAKKTIIPLPPLGEQERIVKIVEARIKSVERIRQAIQEQLKATNIMLDAYIRTIYNSQKQTVKIGEIARINPSIKEMKVKKNNIEVSFIPMSSVDADTGTISYSEKRKLHEVRKGYTYFEDNDIIFAKITPCMQNGKHAIAKNLVNGIGFGSTEFHVIRPSTEVLPEWIHYFLRQSSYLYQAENYMQGAVGQQRLPDDYLYDTIIPLPSIDEQKSHISFLHQKQDKLGRTNKLLIEQAAYIDALPSSILRQAFNGEL